MRDLFGTPLSAALDARTWGSIALTQRTQENGHMKSTHANVLAGIGNTPPS